MIVGQRRLELNTYRIRTVMKTLLCAPGKRARKEYCGGWELEPPGAHWLGQEERRPILPAQRRWNAKSQVGHSYGYGPQSGCKFNREYQSRMTLTLSSFSHRLVSHFYGHGDVCDLTGKPRQVIVKLKWVNILAPAQCHCPESTYEWDSILNVFRLIQSSHVSSVRQM